MRLLLDEMYPPAIAEQLRRRGHDASAVAERPELRRTPDDELFARAQEERRAVVTENVADFDRILRALAAQSHAHFGVVFVSPEAYPRGVRRTRGRMVMALDALLAEHRRVEAASLVLWL